MNIHISDMIDETSILKKINDLFFRDFHQKCLFLKCSEIEKLSEIQNWKNILITAVDELMLDGQVDINFFKDNDIFIVNKSLNYKSINKLTKALDQTLVSINFEKLIKIFELGVDIKQIRKICSDKIVENEKSIQIPPNTKAFLKREIPEADPVMDNKLIQSLSARRSERKSLEILIVEDDEFSQKLLQNTLYEYQSVTIVGDGRLALTNYIQKAPDILFLDIGLPDTDGHTILQKIFTIDPDAFVVMFSGKGDKDNVTKAIQLGAKGFVGKPFAKEKIFQYIKKSPFVVQKSK